jgi:sugar/nucleoside kinase (ribokinase family)
MNTIPLVRFVIAGRLRRSYVITPAGQVLLDIPGGGLFHAAVGMAIWENGIGLLGRAGEDYPRDWLYDANRRGMDTRGVHLLPEGVDLRHFVAYPDADTAVTENPMAQFARLNQPYPKTLLGYTPTPPQIDSRTRPNLLTLRQNDVPDDYLDATSAHLCPLDFLSHTLLPSVLRGGHINTLTLDPGAGYMNPTFWDDMPVLVSGLTAFLCSEEKLRSLFQGRSTEIWEMMETIAGYGAEIVVVKRGSKGQYLYDGGSRARWIVPAYPVTVVDPTGAGDAFCGGFLAGFQKTYDPLQAALHGNISSAMVMEGTHPFYALDALPGLPLARLDSLKDTVRKA